MLTPAIMPAAMRTETGSWFARGVGLTAGVALVALVAFVQRSLGRRHERGDARD